MYNITKSQKLIYDMHTYADNSISTITARLKFEEKVDVSVLKKAICLVVKNNDALRIRIKSSASQVMQYVSEYTEPDLEEKVFETEHDIENYAACMAKEKIDFEKQVYSIVIAYNKEDGKYSVIISINHIIGDAWSMFLLKKELLKYYDELSAGNVVETKKNYTYINHVGKEEAYLKSAAHENDRKYWYDQFEDYDYENKIEVFPDIPGEFAAKRIVKGIGAENTSLIDRISESSKASPFSVVLSLLSVYLHKAGRCNDFCIGTALYNRFDNEDKNTVGMFVNTVPMRITFDKNDSFGSVLKKNVIKSLGIMRHQRYNYGEMLDTLEENIGRKGLYDITFIYQVEPDNVSRINTEWYFCENQNEILAVTLIKENGEYSLIYDYKLGCLDENDVDVLNKRLMQILNSVHENGEELIENVKFASDEEIDTIINVFNNTKVDNKETNVVELFEEAVRSNPGKTALVCGDDRISYSELNSQVNAFAKKLHDNGVEANDFVILLSERDIEMVVGMLAIVKAGAAYVPVDPSLPIERIEYILKDCCAKVILQNSRIELTESKDDVKVIDLKEKLESEANPKNTIKQSDAMYCIYTSGTTGNPKGVIVEHHTLSNLLMYQRHAMDKGCFMNTIFATTISFDVATQEIFSTLTSGGTGYIISLESKMDVKEYSDCCYKYGVDTVFGTSSFFEAVTMYEKGFMNMLESLKYVILAGEQFRINKKLLTNEKAKNLLLYNHYGPTETHVVTCNSAYVKDMDSTTLNIGNVIENTKAYVLSGNSICGIGVPGELCIAGIAVARGYLKLDDLTKERFVESPFGDGKMYRTGDLVKWHPDGKLDCMGRIDDQIKIRGFRIELGEIESKIREIDQIKDCAVIAKTDVTGDKAIFAYMISDELIDYNAINEELGKSLPDYMIPAYMAQIPVMPVTKNGKLDKRSLPDIKTKVQSEYVAPRNDYERIVCGTFAGILNLEKVGIKDDFFGIGGHSLRATLLVNQIAAVTGKRLKIRDIFSNRTPELIAALLDSMEVTEQIRLPKAPEKEYYKMTPVQKRTFIYQQLNPETVTYNMPSCIKITGEVRENDLKAAFQKMVDRHEILRTRFMMIDGVEVQKILPDVKVDFEYIVSDESDEELVRKSIRPFDLSCPPLLRAKLVKKNDCHVLIFDMHHIVADGMSINTFIRELTELYSGNELPEIEKQFKDYSEWLETRNFDTQKAYWKNVFDEPAPILDMPTDFSRKQERSDNGAALEIALGEDICNKITARAKELDVTEYMMFLSALMITLSKYSRQEDIVVGSPISGRIHEDTENMLGMFVNTLAMRGRPENNKRFRDFLAEIKETSLKAYENQEFPFDELVDMLDVKTDMSRNPLFDVLFVLQNNEKVEISLGSAKAERKDFFNNVTKFDLSFSATENNNIYTLSLEYSTDLFTVNTAENILKHFENVLKQIVENVNIKISDIEMITDEEREKVLTVFNDTDLEVSTDKTIMQIFEEQVAKTPEKAALLFENQKMTYAELNRRANVLANKLRADGVKPGDYIAIISDRSFEMIAGIFGIVKSGAAYVPVDPTYPADRIRFMLEDSKPRAVLLYTTEPIELSFDVNVVDLRDESVWEGCGENPENVNGSDDIIYCIYTSGTTGRPKGVMNRHRSVVNLIEWMLCKYPINENDVILQKTTYVFDVSVSEIFYWFRTGGVLALLKKDAEKDPEEIANEIEKFNATVIDFVPSMLSAFIAMSEESLRKISGLKYVLAAGEALNSKLVKDFYKKMRTINSGALLGNIYGPTESCVYATYYDLVKDFDGDTVYIGKPLANTRIYMVNSAGLCGIGVPGELCIAGTGLASGYLNRPELTKERFIDNPYGEGKLYRSGDLARWCANGNIEYLGRIDEQVKVRGFRIELGEIESRIREIEIIRDCAVIVRTDKNGDKAIYAYFTSDDLVALANIREKLRETLPEYMIPAYMMQIEAIPVTKNGKLDKKMLPEILVSDIEAEYVAPSTPEEMVLCEVFSEVLGINKIGVNDRFIDLGGDSIKAIRIVSKLRSRGYEISVKNLLTAGSISKITKFLVKSNLKYNQGDVVGKVEKTPIMREFDSWNYAKPEHFNQAVMYNVDELDNVAITKAIAAIVKHHDMLRAVVRNGEIEILSSDESKLYDFYEFDFTGKDNVDELIMKECTDIQGSIDLAGGPLVKVALFNIGNEKRLMICIHHLVVDGISWRIILEDFNIAVNQIMNGKEAKLPAKTASFSEWSRKLMEYGELIDDKIASYWRDVERRIPEGKIESSSDSRKTEKISRRIKLDKEKTLGLLNNARNVYNSRVNEILLAALAVSVNKVTGQKRIAVELEGHGRETIHESIAIERTVGWFTDIYPVILECSDDLDSVIKLTKETVRSIPNGGLDYCFVKQSDEIPDIWFNYLGDISAESTAENRIDTALTGKSSADENKTLGDIAFNGMMNESVLVFDLTVNGERYSDVFSDKLADAFYDSLCAVVGFCETHEQTEKTASDYGLYGMSTNEFSELKKQAGNDFEKAYRLTPLQEGMLYHSIASPESTSYIIQSVFRVGGTLDVGIVKEALKLLCERFEILKTSVIYEKLENPVQVIISNREIEFVNSGAKSDGEFDKQVAGDLARGFDLKNDSLLRVTYAEIGEYSKMIWTMHHIIVDGWCMLLIFGKFMEIYTKLFKGTALSEIASQIEAEKSGHGEYSEYITWLGKQNAKMGRKYWGELLEGYDEICEIRPMEKPEKTSVQMKRISKCVDKATTEKLKKIANDNNATINTLSEAVCGILLQKYVRAHDVVFGKVVSGRNAEIKGIENMVGLFINTIPLRVETTPETTFNELIKQLHIQDNDSMNYDYCSLSEIQSRTVQGADLIKVIYVFENYLSGTEYDNGNEIRNDIVPIAMESAREQTNYPLSITGTIEHDLLKYDVMYDPNEFPESEIQLILDRIVLICEEAAENPDNKIDLINTATEKEKELIFNQFNATEKEYSKAKTLVDLFEEQTERTPDNTALVFEEQQLTYKELNEKANVLANKLRASGVKQDEFIALIADRSIEMICGIFAVIKAGGAYVPIDPTYPEERINYMLSDCGSRIVLKFTDEDISLNDDIQIIDMKDSGLWKGETSNPEHIAASDNLAYCIYTSGTTGQPKGVMIEHRGVVAMQKYLEDLYEITEKDHVLQFANYIFDASVWEMTMALYCGAALVLVSSETITDIMRFEKYIENNSVTLSLLPPQYFRQINSDCFRVITTGGSAADIDVVRHVKKNCRYINAYGPTENTVLATHWEYVHGSEIRNNIPIGKPISNSKIYMLNQDMICGIGIPGELCITGDGLARGYLNRKELTDEKFVENPFGEGRMYRSGDLAMWLPDGNILYLGRIDEQVKIRGFRIELGEIESKIREIDSISDCAVIAKADKSGEKAIYAYYTSEVEVSASDIKDILSTVLPEYMIPAYMMQIGEIPVTRNGKLDKRALPDITSVSVNEYKAPETDEEKVLCELFESVLSVENVGVNDKFIELGGDSIKAIRMVSKLRSKGYSINVNILLSGGSISKISKLLKKEDSIMHYDQGEVSGKIEKTPIIREFENWNLKHPSYFNQALMFNVSGIDNEVIRKTVTAIVKHHDMLRAVMRNGEIEILPVSESRLFDFYEFDYSGEPCSDAIIEEECTRIQGSIDLERGPLVKVAVFSLNDKKLMMFCVHHLVIDGVSWRIIAEDFNTAAGQISGNKEIRLTEKTASFIEWSKKLNEYKEHISDNEKKYWSFVSDTIHSANISDNTNQTPSEDKIIKQVIFDAAVTDTLLNKAENAFGSKTNELLISALVMALSDVLDQDKVVIGLEGHGREQIHEPISIDRTIGWFTNIYPVILECSDVLRNCVIGTKETLRNVPNGGLGYGFVCENTEKPNVWFNYLGTSDEGMLDVSINGVGKSSADDNDALGEIVFNGVAEQDQLSFILSFAAGKYSKQFADKLADSFFKYGCLIADYCNKTVKAEKTAIDYNIHNMSMNDFDTLQMQLEGECRKIYELTPLQEGMLFHNMIGESSTSYVLQNVFGIEGYLDTDKIENTLSLLNERYEIIGTSIVYKSVEKPMQVIYNERKIELNEIDLTDCTAEEAKNKCSEIAEKDLSRGFDLQTDTLLRLTYIKMADSSKLIWTMHHIIVDGWCMQIIIKKFIEYYQKLSYGISYSMLIKEVELEKTAQGEYSDYIYWLRRQNKEKAKEYWSNLLDGYEENCEIKPMIKPGRSNVNVNKITRELNEDITYKLMSIARANGTTINTVSEVICGIMLQRYAATDDVVFGKVVSGRNAEIPGIENMVGLFINTVPVRFCTSDNTTVSDMFRVMNEQGRNSNEYDFYSLSEIQSVTHQGSDLIKVLYVFENYLSGSEYEKDGGVATGELSITLEESREQTSYSITIMGSVENNKLTYGIMYDPNIFREEEIVLILERLLKISEEVADNPNRVISNLDTVTDREEEIILNSFNATDKAYPADKTVIELIEEQADRNPERIAVVYGDDSITFRQLNEKANAVGEMLRAKGVVPDSFVAVVANRSIEMIVAIYGIVKAGAAYLPIDPSYPEERIRYMLEDSKVPIVLCAHADINFEADVEKIYISDYRKIENRAENLPHCNNPHSLLYLIYTSGTTGRPKGVMCHNTGLINRILWMDSRYTLGEDDVILQKTTYTFDVSVWEIFWWAIKGCKVVMLNQGDEKNPMAICDAIEKYKVTTMHFVPSMLNMFLISIEEMPQYCNKLDSLRFVFSSGEALMTSHSHLFKKLLTDNGKRAKLINFYGPTEASIDVTYYDCTGDEEMVPIGKPIDNIKLYIMNSGNLCGLGIPGELCITGVGVARGYLNRPELTVDKFVDNPFGSGKLYHTGDLARWMPDGNIDYLGRIDEQVKIRGFRIELGEIVNVIKDKIDYVKDCAVTVKTDKSGDKNICAYVVSDKQIDEATIKSEISNFLTSYMVPAYIMQIDSIPITNNGKLNRRALPDIELKRSQDYVAARNEIEESIVKIYEKVLGIDHVGVTDNFFDIGGNSIKLISVYNNIEKLYPGTLKLVEMFSYPSIEALAKYISNANEAKNQQSINITGVKLPGEFFDIDYDRDETSFSDLFDADIDVKLDKYKAYEFFLAVYILLISKMTGETTVVVQTQFESDKYIRQISVDIGEIENFFDIIELIRTAEAETKDIYELKNYIKKPVADESIVPIFVAGYDGFDYGEYYDFVLAFNKKDHISIDLVFNSNILSTGAAEDFFNNLIDISRQIIEGI